jgi:type II secretory pathway pseudopilin PulG
MLAVMTLALMLAMPSWRYLAKDDKEQELIFRGREIANAVARFQRRNGNALPATLEQLVQAKFLRKAYKDPMTTDGKWRFMRPGEVGPARPAGPFAGGGPGRGSPTPTPRPSPTATPAFGRGSTAQSGPIAGVVSLSTDLGLRTVNGTRSYNQWIFAPNVPLIVGALPLSGGPAGGPNQVPAQSGLRSPDLEQPRVSR